MSVPHGWLTKEKERPRGDPFMTRGDSLSKDPDMTHLINRLGL
jgi:hypothetical protein